MTTCIYGAKSYPEGSTICVNGRGLKCVVGEWVETGAACTEADEVVDPATGADSKGGDSPEHLGSPLVSPPTSSV